MIKLDDNLLLELGLGALPKEEKTAFLKHMYETLEMRVGTRLAEKMSDAQMTEFEQFINSNDEQGAFHWLESNFPNYKDVVAEEFEKLKQEIAPLAAQILASSNAHAQQAGPAPAAPTDQPVQSSYAAMQPQPQPAYQQPAAPAPGHHAGAPQQTAQPMPPQAAPPMPQSAPAPTDPSATPAQYPQPVQPPPYTPPQQ